jgi:hypothetical protein
MWVHWYWHRTCHIAHVDDNGNHHYISVSTKNGWPVPLPFLTGCHQEQMPRENPTLPHMSPLTGMHRMSSIFHQQWVHPPVDYKILIWDVNKSYLRYWMCSVPMLFIHGIPLPPYQQNGAAVLNSLHCHPSCSVQNLMMVCTSWQTSIMSPFLVCTPFLALFCSEQLCQSHLLWWGMTISHDDMHLL